MVLIGQDDKGITIRNLRGEESVRLVPVHPALVETGFLRFVEGRAAGGRELLFDTGREGRAELLTGPYYAQSYETFNRRYVTKDMRKGFDSFRRNVQHELQLLHVSTEMCNAITGAVPQYDYHDTAAANRLVTDKHAALARLHYPFLDLQALKEKFSIFTN